MKKILAALIAVVMVLSVSAVAFADVDAVKLTATATTQTRFQYNIAGVTLAANDEVVLTVQLPDITDVATGATAKVKSLTARVYDGGDKFINGQAIDETWAKDLGDGWYELTFKATAACEGMMVAFFYYTEDNTEAQPADGSVMTVAGIKVNGTDVTLDAANFTGKGLTLAAEAVKVTLPGATEETPAETEDAATEDAPVEETGVVSIAVVAVAAVIGGAVVLKKREF
ncbi:MAG: hypothetical protein IKV30_00470 [Clostridia bacterium]|nr:hypothetical protein [Clostridia bacterium]